MAGKKEMDFTYTFLDRLFRTSLGENADFSGAMYNGDYSLSLEEAQRKKHKFVLDSLHIKEGERVIDLGCGWAPMLKFLRDNKISATGLTLSTGQANTCRKNGFDVRVKDCRNIEESDFGKFDAAISLGAFEHFCSVNEWKDGKQDEVYSNFFKHVSDLLPSGKRFYLQTMVFGKNAIDFDEMDVNSDKNSTSYIMSLMVKQFPQSWLPYGFEQIEKNASPYFDVVSKSNGRLDYIETIAQWRTRFRKFSLKKYALFMSLLPKYLTDPNFRYWLEIFKVSPNKVCFEREIMDHYRIVFEKK